MPKRHGRNEDPVGKRAKAAKIASAKAAKDAKASSKRQKEIDAEVAKERLAEIEVDESFSQREEILRRVHRQSDVEGTSDSDDSQTELPLANTGVSGDNTESDDDAEGNNDAEGDDDTEGNNDTSADDDQGSSQQKNAKVSSICWCNIRNCDLMMCTERQEGQTDPDQVARSSCSEEERKEGPKGSWDRRQVKC